MQLARNGVIACAAHEERLRLSFQTERLLICAIGQHTYGCPTCELMCGPRGMPLCFQLGARRAAHEHSRLQEDNVTYNGEQDAEIPKKRRKRLIEAEPPKKNDQWDQVAE